RRVTHLFDRGDWRKPGEPVQPGILKSLGYIPADQADRLSFARWLVSDENPLTARVFVNRIWEQIFGYGIVETMGDFGSQGTAPTHPELLDWLAVQFSGDMNWSVKSLIRTIV